MNLQFLLAAVLLVALTLLVLLRPWQKIRNDAAGPDLALLNTALYREQLAELDREKAEGVLSEAEYATARGELERRMLEDLAHANAPAAKPVTGRRTAWALLLALPIGALGLYTVLGTPEALNPQALQAQAPAAGSHETGVAQIEQMVAKLAAKLESQPDDPNGWAMLGRSYHAIGRMPEAAKAFERVGPTLQQDATLLADYADALASIAGGRTAGRPAELIAQALKVDPNHPMSLSLAATDAVLRNDKPTAIRHWEHLLSLMPADSEDAAWIKGQLAELRGGAPAAPMGMAGNGTAAQAQTQAQPVAAAVVDASKAVSGSVIVAPALAAKIKPDDTLFLFARADQGSRMPLAIQRLRAGQLPLNFQLDDSHAMSPAATLSGAKQVVIEARISQNGTAAPSSGDLFGVSAVVKPGKSGLQIVIDQVTK